jgi:hypothetical protein
MGLSFGQAVHLGEINIRGRAMTMSCDLEFILLKIIVACLADAPNEKAREFKALPMEQKIAMLKHDLKEYYPEHYTKYLTPIKALNKICIFRNKFAHCKIEWDKKQKDVSYFNLLIISDVKGKEKPQLIKMTFVEFERKMEKMRSALMQLVELCREIEIDFLHKYPNFFKASQS